jgi:hypothetical protein
MIVTRLGVDVTSKPRKGAAGGPRDTTASGPGDGYQTHFQLELELEVEMPLWLDSELEAP